MTQTNDAARKEKILAELRRLYPDAGPELHFTNPFETLVATMLSAQCTDKRVNVVTEKLFARYKCPADIAAITPEELEPQIRECGLYHNKARNIVAACRMICEQYGGQVPGDWQALNALPGVGRKTANVVYANAFHGDAIAVDTHVFRVSNRLGLAHAKDVGKTEEQLMQAIPKSEWSKAHHYLIFHGRRVCSARAPKCETCTLRDLCEYYAAKGAQAENKEESAK
ncbi:MAG: endonuclease III [Candidatus Spyradocola sp.]